MARPNQFEDSLFNAALSAHDSYRNVAREALRHAPESFIQTVIALELSKSGYIVYPDSTLKKVFKNHGAELPAYNEIEKKRFDLVVWSKSDKSIKSIIEIKKSRGHRGASSDSKKLSDYFARGLPAKSAYLIVYSDAESASILESRFRHWADRCGAKLFEPDIEEHDDPRDGKAYDGLALMRLTAA